MKTNRSVFGFILIIGCIFAEARAIEKKQLVWSFPLPRTHTGMLIGNGTQGLMIWGQENQLHITIGHEGFWDHRAGNDILDRITFSELKQILQSKDHEALKKAFEIPVNTSEPHFDRPKQLGGGRLEIRFPSGYQLKTGTLDLKSGRALVTVADVSGKLHVVTIRQAVDRQLAWLDLPDDGKAEIKLVSVWDHIKSELLKGSVKQPKVWHNEDGGGFVQFLPEDDPLALAWLKKDRRILIATAIAPSAQDEVNRLLTGFDVDQTTRFADEWWNAYWTSVPQIRLPDPVLQEIVDYGLYKQACVTPPHAKPAGLQGPFLEEYQMIPWSNDYHFNINVQMIYTPAFASNRPDHLNPLWEMIHQWMPRLKATGERFFDRKNALIIPHAVDDRGQVIGTFWTGTIDHGCTAWVAYMAWQHYRYTMDKHLLEQTAWPLLVGAFEGFWSMLEETKDSDGKRRLRLPVSVSPEYGGSRPTAWGRDASFQLAALHRVALILPKAAQLLGKEQDQRWKDVQLYLPQYAIVDDAWWPENQAKGPRIALWEGQDLVGSHRHHSHLAGLFPFVTIDPKDEKHKTIVDNTIRNWTFKGAGNWAAWSIPWASTIWSRLENPEAAVMWLHYWRQNYVNEGRGSLYKAAFKGATLISDHVWSGQGKNAEIMQLDAGMDALNAVFEMFVQNREDIISVLPAIHRDWKDFSFDNILAEGAFLIGAKVNGGKKKEITIVSQKGGLLQLDHGLGNSFLVNGKPSAGRIFVADTAPGELITLSGL